MNLPFRLLSIYTFSIIGYVQGMSDLLTPLFLVCVQPFAADPLRCDVAALDSAILADIEVRTCISLKQ